jgi:arsenate reductase-like glutaredoxin family protein
MSVVDDLRQVQLDIRLVQNKLQDITVEEKNHPARTKPGDKHDKVTAWHEIRNLFEKRRTPLKARLAELQEERLELEHKLRSTPMTKATLGHIIAQLLEVEIKFSTDTWGDAWESLSAFIDWLEQEERKLPDEPALKAVA